MNCLHPFTRKYQDAVTGEWKECTCPCGKCINCLHAYQDMWTIRLNEAAKQFKCMIYDTLTVRPSSMSIYRDYTKPDMRLQDRFPEGTLYGTTVRYANWKVDAIKKHYKAAQRYFPTMSKESYELLKKNDFKVPVIEKEEVQKWIKRGRQFYKRDKGHDAHMAYFLVQEYGPQTSRQHFHILVFGLNYSDYMHYWGNAWREQFGWTKPVYKEYNSSTMKDYNCMVRYVSKYVSKGVFETPWIQDNIAPKPYRLISKGLGAGYLAKDFFSPFRSEEFEKWKAIGCPSRHTFEEKCKKLAAEQNWKELYAYKADYNRKRQDMEYYLGNKRENEFVADVCEPGSNYTPKDYVDISRFTEEDMEHLQVYYDAGGFPHALPRYYKYKLLKSTNNEPNIYQFEVQSVLQSRARLHDNQNLQAFAAQLGFRIPDEYLDYENPLCELSPCDAFMVSYKYNLAKRSQAQVVAERRYSRLKNFYNRAKMNLQSPALQ